MSDIITALSDISEGYDAVLCDLWGCYHNGIKPYAEAMSALTAYRAQGGMVALLTNAPRPDFSVAAHLERMGGSRESYDLIVSSGDATLVALNTGAFGQKFFHVGPERDLDLVAEVAGESVPLAEAEYILCSGLEDDLNEGPEDFVWLYDAGLAGKLPMISANPDIIVDRGKTRLPCAGALAQAYAERGGETHSFGKPHRPIYELAFAKLAALAGREIDPARVLAIGDGPATDLKGAADFGIDALFIAGGLAAEALLDESADVAASKLENWLVAQNAAPQKTLAFLR